jgi:hypothetical protein
MKITNLIKLALLAISIVMGMGLGFFTGMAKAETILVPNGDFEQHGALTNGNVVLQGADRDEVYANDQGLNWTGVVGWTYKTHANNAYGQLGATGGGLPLETQGSFVGFLNIADGWDAYITSTDPIATIAANTTYTLTVSLGDQNGTTGNWKEAGNLTIGLLANDVVIGITSVPTGTIQESPDDYSNFQDFTFSFSTGDEGMEAFVGQSLKIQMSQGGTGGVLYQAYFDNVRLEAMAVPEPATQALLLGGILGAGCTMVWQRRRVS